MKTTLLIGAALAALTLAAATNASAAIAVYSGQDDGAATSGPFPNSAVAHAAFIAGAGGPLAVETFDTQAQGNPGSLSIADGANVTWNGTNFGDGFSGVSQTTFGNLYGFDTDSGRGNWLGFPGGSATFTFAHGVRSFGMYLTGLQTEFTSSLTIAFNDGSPRGFLLPVNVSGGAQFWGLHDTNPFSSVTISNSSIDAWGVDDVSYSAGVPEPASWALMIGGFGLAGAVLRRRRAAVA